MPNFKKAILEIVETLATLDQLTNGHPRVNQRPDATGLHKVVRSRVSRSVHRTHLQGRVNLDVCFLKRGRVIISVMFLFVLLDFDFVDTDF